MLGVDQTPLNTQPRVLHNSTDLESSTGRLPEFNESIEDSAAVLAAARQPSVIVSKRSVSELAPNTIESSSASSFGARFPLLPRSTSDLIFTHNDQSRRRTLVSENPSDHYNIRDQVVQSPADFQCPHQTGPGHHHQRQTSSEVQVPGSADRSSHQSHGVDVSPADSLVFQTQIPLAFASQGSRVSITSPGTSSGNLIPL